MSDFIAENWVYWTAIFSVGVMLFVLWLVYRRWLWDNLFGLGFFHNCFVTLPAVRITVDRLFEFEIPSQAPHPAVTLGCGVLHLTWLWLTKLRSPPPGGGGGRSLTRENPGSRTRRIEVQAGCAVTLSLLIAVLPIVLIPFYVKELPFPFNRKLEWQADDAAAITFYTIALLALVRYVSLVRTAALDDYRNGSNRLVEVGGIPLFKLPDDEE
ncbi:MAG: hypothetical protein AAFV43_09415 [Planctomycetota bacterium]